MMANSNPSAEVNNESDTRIVTEIPPAMNALVAWIARAFYSLEHYVVLDLIRRCQCIQDEALQKRTYFEVKFLRQILGNLLADKLIRERQVSEKTVDGSNLRSTYYWINYKAIVNVTKYKLDHVRLKLEQAGRTEADRALYSCTICNKKYNLLDVNTLIDPRTGEMKCPFCNGVVNEEKNALSTDEIRDKVSRFNEQTAPLIDILRQLDGVQLAPQLLEPNLLTAVRENADKLVLQESVTTTDSKNKLPALGGRPTLAMLDQKNQVIVDLGDASTSEPTAVSKEQPTWLKSSSFVSQSPHASRSSVAVAEEGLAAAAALAESAWMTEEPESSEDVKPRTYVPELKTDVMQLLAHEFEQVGEKPEVKMETKVEPKEEAIKKKESSSESESEEASDEEEEELKIMVNGKEYSFAEVQRNPELARRMTAEERSRFVDLCQRAFT